MARAVRLERTGPVAVLSLVFTLVLGYYLALEPTPYWSLLLLVLLVALGMDGLVRALPQVGPGPLGTFPYLVLPVLYSLGAGLLLEDITTGYWSWPLALLAGIAFGALVRSELITADPAQPAFVSARLLLNVLTYVTASALYAVIYIFEVDLAPGALVAGSVSVLLGLEVLREPEMEPGDVLVQALVIGIVVAETRWALYFVPLEGYLAGLGLLLAFYLVSGLLRAHLVGHLTWWQGFEYAVVTVTGVGVVVGAEVAGG
jgi:hypothetical protein